MTLDQENWRPIGGYEGIYEVSDLGRVRSLDRLRVQPIAKGPDRTRMVERLMRGRVLRPIKAKSGGYLRVSLSDGARGAKIRKIHQLVAEAFLPPCPKPFAPLHGDGNPENNRLSNLRYGSPGANVDDAKRHGTFCIGSRRPQAKLDEIAASIVKTLVELPPARLARVFGVSTSAIRLIRKGENWPHVSAMSRENARRELDRRAA